MVTFYYDLEDWERTETVPIVATITDSTSGEPADPTNVDITIKNSEDTVVVNDADMTKSAIGSYYYDYTIPADAVGGPYYGWVEVTGSTGRVVIKTFKFTVQEEIA